MLITSRDEHVEEDEPEDIDDTKSGNVVVVVARLDGR